MSAFGTKDPLAAGSEHFIDRRRRVKLLIPKIFGKNATNSVYIVGSPGSGRTSILNQLDEAELAKTMPHELMICRTDWAEHADDPDAALAALREAMASALESRGETAAELRAVQSLMTAVDVLLAKTKGRVLLVIDNADVAGPSLQVEHQRQLRQAVYLKKRVGYLLACSLEPVQWLEPITWDDGSDFAGILKQWLNLLPARATDLKTCLDQSQGRRPGNRALAEHLVELVGGHVGWLQRVLGEAYACCPELLKGERGLDDDLREQLRERAFDELDPEFSVAYSHLTPVERWFISHPAVTFPNQRDALSLYLGGWLSARDSPNFRASGELIRRWLEINGRAESIPTTLAERLVWAVEDLNNKHRSARGTSVVYLVRASALALRRSVLSREPTSEKDLAKFVGAMYELLVDGTDMLNTSRRTLPAECYTGRGSVIKWVLALCGRWPQHISLPEEIIVPRDAGLEKEVLARFCKGDEPDSVEDLRAIRSGIIVATIAMLDELRERYPFTGDESSTRAGPSGATSHMASTSTLTAVQVCQAMSVDGWPGLYLLGSYDRRITFRAQQARALSLVRALVEAGELREDSEVAVVGGGVSGTTAATALAALGYRVTLYESSKRLMHIQANCTDRYVHPHIYDWPMNRHSMERAGLPIMDWTAGSAESIVGSLRSQVEEVRVRCEPRFQIAEKRRINEITHIGGVQGQPRLRVQDDRGHVSQSVHVAIVAVGFGLERSAFSVKTEPYWGGNILRGPWPTEPEILVSGSGDGGLVDLADAALEDFRHAEFVAKFTQHPELVAFGEAIAKMEEKLGPGGDRDPDRTLYKEYERVPLPRSVLGWMGDQKRETRVTYNFTRTQFTLSSSLHNRLTTFLLLKAGLVTPRRGRIVDVKRDGERFVVRFEDDGSEVFDTVILRHGPDGGPIRAIQLTPLAGRASRNLAEVAAEVGRAIGRLGLTGRLSKQEYDWYRKRLS